MRSIQRSPHFRPSLNEFLFSFLSVIRVGDLCSEHADYYAHKGKLYALQFSAQTTDVFKVLDLVDSKYRSAPPSAQSTPGRGVSQSGKVNAVI